MNLKIKTYRILQALELLRLRLKEEDQEYDLYHLDQAIAAITNFYHSTQFPE